MKGTVRRFEDADYPAIVAVVNSTNPANPSTPEGMSYWDSNREARIVWGRLVYEEDGEVLGTAHYSLMAWMFHPRKYLGYVSVLPECRKRGIGSALLDRVQSELDRNRALSIIGDIRDDDAESRRFFEKRGFADGERELESGIDLTRFEPERFAESVGRVEARGIRLVGYEDLAGDPDRHRKLYVTEGTSEKDMPASATLTQPSFENYCVKIFDNPRFRGDLMVVAVDGENYVGVSGLWDRSVPGILETGFTGVLREYRGRGIATALKVATLARAKSLGFEQALTWNDSTNEGMLGINRRLGFEKRIAWISYSKKFHAEEGGGAEPASEKEDSA